MLIDSIEPIHVVNDYLWDGIKGEMLKTLDDPTVSEQHKTAMKKRYSIVEIPGSNPKEYTIYGGVRPIFPVNDSVSGDAKWINRPYLVFTEAFRVSHGLHVTKKATFIYSLKANIDDHLGWASALQAILDRQDDAAADVNEYNLALMSDPNPEVRKTYCPVVFHSFRVYQNEPAKPSGAISSPAVTSTFMVVAEYHLI